MSAHFRGRYALAWMGAAVGLPSSVQDWPEGESW